MSLLKITEVAQLLRVSRVTACKLCETGQIRAIRVGTQYRVHAADLAAYLSPQPIVASTLEADETIPDTQS